MTTALPRKHPLHDSIDKHNIRRVAVVDDAFDPVSLASFQEGEDQEFLDAMNAQDVLLAEFHQIVSETHSDELISNEDLTDAALGRLWERRNKPGNIGPVLARTLFRVLDLKVTQVEQLFAFLKRDLGIKELEKYGTTAEMPDGEFDLAFVDYRFGPSRQDSSVDRAVRWATHLYKQGRTFIILMSAEAEAFVRQEVFRNKSNLTRGLFGFVDKKEIAESDKFSNRLNSFCAGFNTRHEIHRFASAAETAIDEAVSELKKSIRGLGLEDYAYLEQISLQHDGHPLGDYMLWLFGEYFGHELAVNSSLQPTRMRVNGLEYEHFLPLQRPPSSMLAKMYGAAITEPVHEGWNAHPRDPQCAEVPAGPIPTPLQEAVVAPEAALTETPTAEPAPESENSSSLADTPAAPAAVPPPGAPSTAKGLPLYQLGDLIVADKHKPAFLVLNAGCDLQFSPGQRDVDPEQTILLIPGRFEPLHEHRDDANIELRHEKSAKRTELFELSGERFRIIWHHTRARAVPHHMVRGEHEPKGYQRTSRLKLPYALEIQQHFAAQLTRVGVPTPTPVFQERTVQVYSKDPDGNYVSLGAVPQGVIVFHHREEDQFILTVDCLHAILDCMNRFASEGDAALKEQERLVKEAQGATAAVPDEQTLQQASRRRKYLKSLRNAQVSLSRHCDFQDTLSSVPSVGGKLIQLDQEDPQKSALLEVHHVQSLQGKCKSNAPCFIAFSLAAPRAVESSVSPEAEEKTVP